MWRYVIRNQKSLFWDVCVVDELRWFFRGPMLRAWLSIRKFYTVHKDVLRAGGETGCSSNFKKLSTLWDSFYRCHSSNSTHNIKESSRKEVEMLLNQTGWCNVSRKFPATRCLQNPTTVWFVKTNTERRIFPLTRFHFLQLHFHIIIFAMAHMLATWLSNSNICLFYELSFLYYLTTLLQLRWFYSVKRQHDWEWKTG